MCQYSKTNRLYQLKKDRTVYKRIILFDGNKNEGMSLTQRFLYTIGETYTENKDFVKNDIEGERSKNNIYPFSVHTGFHSYTNLQQVRQTFDDYTRKIVVIVKCTIPAGAWVIKGIHPLLQGGYVDTIVSTSIRINRALDPSEYKIAK
jgi:hypothetical protein